MKMSLNGYHPNGNKPIQLNVLGKRLEGCSKDPLTGFFRDGSCNTSPEDVGSHTVCGLVTQNFLDFSKQAGNDLSTPNPKFGFPGLKPGDCWCICASRWQEALQANCACPVKLEATHIRCLDYIELSDLLANAA